MRWPWSKPEAEDRPGTALGPLVERLESLERRMSALADDVAESQDTIVRRLDKYRKRVEREDAPEGTEPLPPAPVPSGRLVRPHPVVDGVVDVLAIRRGRPSFPGGGR